jgi:hypothetical protein
MEFTNLNEQRKHPGDQCWHHAPEEVDLSTVMPFDVLGPLGKMDYSTIGFLHTIWYRGYRLEKREETPELQASQERSKDYAHGLMQGWLEAVDVARCEIEIALQLFPPQYKAWTVEEASRWFSGADPQRYDDFRLWKAWKVLDNIVKARKEAKRQNFNV